MGLGKVPEGLGLFYVLARCAWRVGAHLVLRVAGQPGPAPAHTPGDHHGCRSPVGYGPVL